MIEGGMRGQKVRGEKFGRIFEVGSGVRLGRGQRGGE